MSPDEIHGKFRSLARTVKDEKSVDSILGLYQELEGLKNLAGLVALLR
jgi:hypothetical protein